METTINKTVKASTMDALFESCDTFSIRHYEAKDMIEDEYEPENKYSYEIRVRHAENTDANVLFEQAVFKEENLKKTTYKIEIEITANSESGFEISVDEVCKKIKEGYLLGRDGNEDEEYSFAVTKS